MLTSVYDTLTTSCNETTWFHEFLEIRDLLFQNFLKKCLFTRILMEVGGTKHVITLKRIDKFSIKLFLSQKQIFFINVFELSSTYFIYYWEHQSYLSIRFPSYKRLWTLYLCISIASTVLTQFACIFFMKSFLHSPYSTINNEEAFLQGFLVILKHSLQNH